ncbi:hypothetical protein DOTSEDRAFT_73185, partial [Dothistroma septosporum NZE10]
MSEMREMRLISCSPLHEAGDGRLLRLDRSKVRATVHVRYCWEDGHGGLLAILGRRVLMRDNISSTLHGECGCAVQCSSYW